MSDALVNLIAKRFIQQRAVKSVQLLSKGRVIYVPDRELTQIGMHAPLGFRQSHLQNHLNGTATYGHYLLDAANEARLFVFDVDLKKTGHWVAQPPYKEGMDITQWEQSLAPQPLGDPNNPADESLRNAWLTRSHPSRTWLKMQMGTLARKLVSGIQKELDLPCAAAYSGGKGIHVYGFTGPLPASDVREAALVVLDNMGEWELERGNSQFRHKLQDPVIGYSNFSLEVYPKQTEVDKNGLGNLVRLPLGRNLKSNDPTFFLDLTTAPADMKPHPDPVRLLETGDPYSV